MDNAQQNTCNVADVKKLQRPWIVIAAIVLLFVVNISQLYRAAYFSWLVVAITFILLLAITKFGGLTAKQVGFGKGTFKRGLIWGSAALLLIAVVLLVVYLIKPSAFLDTRYDYNLKQMLYKAFVFIPLHTVFVEEFAFRGVLWAGIKSWKNVFWATIISSILFGLWHIVPSLGLGETSTLAGSFTNNSVLTAILPIAGSVFATTIFGIIMCELRRRSGSLVAPIMAHWAVNGLAVFFAYLAWAQ